MPVPIPRAQRPSASITKAFQNNTEYQNILSALALPPLFQFQKELPMRPTPVLSVLALLACNPFEATDAVLAAKPDDPLSVSTAPAATQPTASASGQSTLTPIVTDEPTLVNSVPLSAAPALAVVAPAVTTLGATVLAASPAPASPARSSPSPFTVASQSGLRANATPAMAPPIPVVTYNAPSTAATTHVSEPTAPRTTPQVPTTTEPARSSSVQSPAAGAPVHVLQPGETFSQLGRDTGIAYIRLLAANSYTQDDHQRAGDTVRVTGVSDGRWTVRRGQTLSAIGCTVGVRVADLMAANGITNADDVHAGVVLVIPQAVR